MEEKEMLRRELDSVLQQREALEDRAVPETDQEAFLNWLEQCEDLEDRAEELLERMEAIGGRETAPDG